MSGILTEVKDIVDKLQNKVRYQIYKAVNDDDANTFVEEKNEKNDKTEKVQEEYASNKSDKSSLLNSITTPKDATDTSDKVNIKSIIMQIYNTLVLFFKKYFIYIIIIFLASNVANEFGSG